MKKSNKHFILLLQTFSISSLSYAVDSSETSVESLDAHEEIRLYRTPEERREAGFGTAVTDWLNVSGLLEVEKIYKDDRFINNQTSNRDERRSHTLQLGFETEFSDSLSANIVLEAEYLNRLDTKVEESVLSYDSDDWSVELGYQDLPFGEYYSHFISGPLLEFGETTGTTLVIDYSVSDYFDTIAYIFDGKTRKLNNDTDLGWGLGVEFTNDDESFKAGVGYLSNLGESNEYFLEDTDNAYAHKVPAINIFALIEFTEFELTAEYISSLKSFDELDSDQNKPASYNIELSWFFNDSTQVAIRIENSDEFAEEPQWQYGIAFTWRLNDNLSISTEYLRAEYKNNFVFDDDRELEKHQQFGLQMSFEF